MERDFNNFASPFMDYYANPNDMNDIYKDPMFNPSYQYEQAYMYYRYLCMQMDYKLKCKEYERLCGNDNRNIRDRKIE